MERKEELLKLFENVDESKKILAIEVIENIVFLEEQICALRKMPQIAIHPTMKEIQKRTDASKMLVPYLQQYNICIKLLNQLLGFEGGEDDGLSILRDFQEKIKDL